MRRKAAFKGSYSLFGLGSVQLPLHMKANGTIPFGKLPNAERGCNSIPLLIFIRGASAEFSTGVTERQREQNPSIIHFHLWTFYWTKIYGHTLPFLHDILKFKKNGWVAMQSQRALALKCLPGCSCLCPKLYQPFQLQKHFPWVYFLVSNAMASSHVYSFAPVNK